MVGLRETLEDGGAYNSASNNIDTGSSNYIEEIIQSSWNKFRESIDLLHSSMAQRLEKVEEEVRSLKSTLEDVLTLNEIVGEGKVTKDSESRSSHVFNAECKRFKNLERGQLQKMQAFKQEVSITVREQRRITTHRNKTISLKIM